MKICFGFDDDYNVLGIAIERQDRTRKAYPIKLPEELVKELQNNKDIFLHTVYNGITIRIK